MVSETYPASPGRNARLRGYLPLNDDVSPMVTHGSGALTNLIRSRSATTLTLPPRRPSSIVGRDTPDDEEALPETSPRKPTDNDSDGHRQREDRRSSMILNGSQMRSMRLIGNSNPRYRWQQYWKTEEELKKMKKPIRRYYERNNSLIQQYIYIDRLLDSSLPHDLLNDYADTHSSIPAHQDDVEVPATIPEEDSTPDSASGTFSKQGGSSTQSVKKVKRTPKDLYKVPSEETPLFTQTYDDDDDLDRPKAEIPGVQDNRLESGDRIVEVAININLAANTILLAGKIAVIVLTSSLSVLASLVDAALDFLSTAIVWTTSRMIARQDQYLYPVGRRRLEPIGVLVFSVVMVTSFFQVGLECVNRLRSDDREIIQLGLPSLSIMASTVLIKALCWLWCRLIKNSSVQALAQDAQTDVVFNIFSIIFPVIGFYAKQWWLDALGGLLLSIFVIVNWAGTSAAHIRNLTGAAATADERNVLLYLTMRFAKTIKQIQGLQAYHSGDKLNVEVDVVLDENTSLRDSHDLGESLQYVLESVPIVGKTLDPPFLVVVTNDSKSFLCANYR
ncbi:MAG: hypothetical protein M1818_001077 [Claussenomyces sp. TS43310]|nr:MAG: hypothetical protein M1818_001077 [Claussenomyces sp. TS43310]